MSHTSQADSSEYIVIRPHSDLESTDLSSVTEGEWRKRADLDTEEFIEILGPNGVVRAYPVDRIEQSRAGDVAQVYEVPDIPDDGDDV